MRCWSLPFVCSKQQSVIQQLQARKGRLIVMCSKGDANLMCPNGGCRVIEVPQLQDCLQPIINIVPFQVYFDLSCCIYVEGQNFSASYNSLDGCADCVLFLCMFAAVSLPFDSSAWLQCGPTSQLSQECHNIITDVLYAS
jgi:hypothetical protein